MKRLLFITIILVGTILCLPSFNPAYGQVLSESFDSLSLPSGWAVIDNATTGAVWRFDDPCGVGNQTAGSGGFATADSDCAEDVMDTQLRTPALDMSGHASVTLLFKTVFSVFSGNEVADVDVSINGSSGPWENVWRKTDNYWGPAEAVDISATAGGQSSVMIRFHYYNADYDWYWQVDDVVVYGALVPVIAAIPSSLDFDSVTVGQVSAPQIITLRNQGTGDLNVSDAYFTGADAAMFNAVGGGSTPCPSLPTALTPGAECTLEVTFSPSSSGAKSAALSIFSNDPDTPQLDVPVSGSGRPPTYDLTVSIVGTGLGNVVSSPGGIDCGDGTTGDCSNIYSEGTEIALTATPGADSTFAGWSGTDCSGLTNPCMFTVISNSSVFAQFGLATHTITASVTNGVGGTITPSGAVSVTDGEDQAFTITPDEGYRVQDVLVDGESIGSVSTYTFYSVVENHTIEVQFGSKRDDLVVDFGSYGTFVLYNGTSWSKIHGLSPTLMATGDLDGSGQGDLVAAFAGYGTFVYYNDSSWSKLHGLSPTLMATGDLDGDGDDDLIAVFAGYGTFVYSNSSWTKLHNLSPSLITTGDMDGGGQDELIAAFEGYGLYVYYNNTSWSKLHSLVPELMDAHDIDFSGNADLIADFGPAYGTFAYYDNSTWEKLHNLSPTLLLAGDVGGIVLGFNGYGLYYYDDEDGTWEKLHGLVPEAGVLAAIYGNDDTHGIFDFGSYGIWVFDYPSTWTKLHSLTADDDAGMCATEMDGN